MAQQTSLSSDSQPITATFGARFYAYTQSLGEYPVDSPEHKLLTKLQAVEDERFSTLMAFSYAPVVK